MSPWFVMFIATGFYSGYLPKAPGTWGTVVALPINLLLIQLEPKIYFTSLVAIFVISIITAGSAEKIVDHKDPGLIVIDEIIGMLIALIYVPATPLAWGMAFLIFRFFDIIKPFPISWVDKHLNGGTGIVMDDVLAGIYTLVIMQLILKYSGLLG